LGVPESDFGYAFQYTYTNKMYTQNRKITYYLELGVLGTNTNVYY